MRVIVTGGAGFIGSAVVRTLVRNGHPVLNIDKLTYAGDLRTVALVADAANYSFLQGDISDTVTMRAAFADFEPDVVVHLAAESHVDRSIDGPASFIDTNLVGTFVLLDAALDYNKGMPEPARDAFRFLHISTDEVYGSLGEEGHFSETTPYDPSSPYSASKAGADHLVRAWHTTYGLPAIISNCSNNYGPFQNAEKLIPNIIRSALLGSVIPIYGEGKNVRDWLYVDDHVSALELIIRQGRVGEKYNVGGGAEVANVDLAFHLCRILDRLEPRNGGGAYEDQITFVTDRPGHDFRYSIDASKIGRELGWRPARQLEKGLESTVQWYLDNRDWWMPRAREVDRLGLHRVR